METDNNVEKRDIITLKKQIPLIKQSMAMFGYYTNSIKKTNSNWIITLKRTVQKYDENQLAYQKSIEEKLRLIEITTRKKCRYNKLFLNLICHVILFCIQGVILYRLKIEDAHPKIMLEIGVLLFALFLVISFVYKGIEIFKWNKMITRLKNDIFEKNKSSVIQKPDKRERIISVLFTRNSGFISNIIYWTSGRQYTHASLGLGEQTEEFFSFDYRGFRREHPGHRKIKNNQKDSLCYQFKVTLEEYRQVEHIIQDYLLMQSNFKYNLVGAVFSIFHIYMPIKAGKVYFCSEFVSEQLRAMESFKLKKQANMYLPTNLSKALIFQDNLYRVLVNEV